MLNLILNKMKKFLLIAMVMFFISLISCEKDEMPKMISVPKENLKECRGCSGTWDLSDTKP
jgi:hypothetical protein